MALFGSVDDPVLWLGGFADEENLLGGSLRTDPDVDMTLFIIPEISERRRSGRQGRGRRRHGHKRKGRKDTEEESQEQEGETMEVEPMETSESEKEQVEQLRRELLWSQDFFADLPLGARQFETTMPPDLLPPQKKTDSGYSYLTYSYSSCATLDDNGRPVESTRRRYEDSTGALKALHRCQMGDRTLTSSWYKKHAQDEGKHSKQVSSGEVEEFEKEWKETTPFGAMEEQAMQCSTSTTTPIVKPTSEGQVPDAPMPQEIP